MDNSESYWIGVEFGTTFCSKARFWNFFKTTTDWRDYLCVFGVADYQRLSLIFAMASNFDQFIQELINIVSFYIVGLNHQVLLTFRSLKWPQWLAFIFARVTEVKED